MSYLVPRAVPNLSVVPVGIFLGRNIFATETVSERSGIARKLRSTALFAGKKFLLIRGMLCGIELAAKEPVGLKLDLEHYTQVGPVVKSKSQEVDLILVTFVGVKKFLIGTVGPALLVVQKKGCRYTTSNHGLCFLFCDSLLVMEKRCVKFAMLRNTRQ